MHLPTRYENVPECARLLRVLGFVGDKWSVLIIMILWGQPRRFNELKRVASGISQQMLARTLKGLERYGLVSRTVNPTIPPQVTYALTDLGTSLAVPLHQLGLWVDEHIDEIQTRERAFVSAEE